MKKLLFLDIGAHFLFLLWMFLPIAFAYIGALDYPPTLQFCFLLPFCMIAFNVYISRKHKNKFFIWRAIPCVLILALGYYVAHRYCCESGYYLVSPISEVILQIEFYVFIGIVVVPLALYQLATFIMSVLEKRKING